jgi:hypothetical protein
VKKRELYEVSNRVGAAHGQEQSYCHHATCYRLAKKRELCEVSNKVSAAHGQEQSYCHFATHKLE